MRSESKRAKARRYKHSSRLTASLLADPARLSNLENLCLARSIGYHAGVLFRLREEVYAAGRFQRAKVGGWGSKGRSRLWWARYNKYHDRA